MESNLWSIVLAGNVPQPPTVVEQTVARLRSICPGHQTVVVLNESQRDHVRRSLPGPGSGRLVFQPGDRGTAAGLLFGLLPVLTTDPAALVVVAPSTQAVENTDAFQQDIGEAVAHARRRFDAVLFVGRKPWTRAVWNTGVIVAPARTLFDLCRRRLPSLSAVFVAALTMPLETRRRLLAAQYPQLPSRDLARHVLMASTHLADSTGQLSPGWSALTTQDQPERVMELAH